MRTDPAGDLYSYVASRLGKTRSEAKRDLFMHAYGQTVPQLAALKHDPKLDQLVSDVKAKLMRTLCIDLETLDPNNAMHYVGCSKGSMSSAQPNLQNIPKAQPVNKTEYVQHLETQLVAAKVAEAEQAVIDKRAADLARYFRLHAATGAVLTDIRDKAITPRALVAEFRSELKALAAEFGYRIVLVGDRTAAVLVQQ